MVSLTPVCQKQEDGALLVTMDEVTLGNLKMGRVYRSGETQTTCTDDGHDKQEAHTAVALVIYRALMTVSHGQLDDLMVT